jgi:hypothetical protein
MACITKGTLNRLWPFRTMDDAGDILPAVTPMKFTQPVVRGEFSPIEANFGIPLLTTFAGYQTLPPRMARSSSALTYWQNSRHSTSGPVRLDAKLTKGRREWAPRCWTRKFA